MLKLLKWTLIALIGLVALLYAGGYALSPKFSAAGPDFEAGLANLKALAEKP
jgi:hypothetical protein